jgi:WNK lysine deficient protein kinase
MCALQSNEELGRGAYKVVYKAIDRDQGLEVAWNQIRLEQGTDFVKLWKEILILQQLNHPNIIGYHHAWVDEQKLQVVFITECMTSGTLKQLRISLVLF